MATTVAKELAAAERMSGVPRMPLPLPFPRRRALVIPILTGALLAGSAASSMLMAQTWNGLGVYVGHPNGSDKDEEARFEAKYGQFKKALGQDATTMDLFVDYTQKISTWPGNADWGIWSMSNSNPVKKLVPIVSVGLADRPTGAPGGNWNRAAAIKMMNDVGAGAYDDVYKAIVTAYGAKGYTRIYLRLGWEMDGGWEPWYATADAEAAAAFASAFKRVVTVARQVNGIQTRTVWCPASINWAAVDVTSTYPGDAYVDVIGPDLYSTVYPSTKWDWDTGNELPDTAAWAASAVNREHYWDYPNYTQWQLESSGGFGLVAELAFAKKHHKPFGLSECGAGNNGSTTGPADEGDFPIYLAARLSEAIGQGIAVEFVDVWDDNVSDGSWCFSDGTKPNELAGWKQFVRTMALAAAGRTARRYEIEDLPVAGIRSQSETKPAVLKNDPLLSNSSASVFPATVVGDSITYLLAKVPPGRYDVRIGVKKAPGQGAFQLSAGPVGDARGLARIGAPQDENAASSVYPELDLGPWTNPQTGDKWFSFTVVGPAEPARVDRSLCLDYLLLVPQ